MSLDNCYCTVEQLQQKLTRKTDSYDLVLDKLEGAITSASRYIDNQTSRFYYRKDIVNEKVDRYGISTNGLYLNSTCTILSLPAPIIGSATIIEDGVSLVAEVDFFIYPDKIDRDDFWTTSRKGLDITCTIGYEETPQKIIDICLSVAEVCSGLGIMSVIDANGDQQDILKNNIPRWVLNALQMEARKIVV